MDFAYESKIDPITFEILRHRLFSINDEAASTLKAVSGSPVANEAFDFNTGLMDAHGNVVVLGIYISLHALSLGEVVQYIIREYQDNPGINPGDMFICNDPYFGVLHQSDVVCVAPIFYHDKLVGWSGAVIHQVDVGGPIKGSQCSLGADSIFQEAPVMPPLKLVEQGQIRKDIKQEYLRRSRFPKLVELDLRAKLAANNTAKKRIIELIDHYGLETVMDVMVAITNYTEIKFKERLKSFSDGQWQHISYLEYENKVYPCQLTLTKQDDQLFFDFTGTASQAPAVVNCTLPAAKGSLLVSILAYLCYDIPWSPAGILKAIDIKLEEGTVISAKWPAGVSKATTGGCQAAVNVSAVCLAKMMATNQSFLHRVMANWIGGFGTLELFGLDQRGNEFGSVFLEAMVGGNGATGTRDGLDTGGMIQSISCSRANVETYEFRYPVVYLANNQQCDSGGAGKYRGGVGLSCLYMVHGVDEIQSNLMLTFVPENAESTGVIGGYPGSTICFAIKRNTNIYDLLSNSSIPQETNELDGDLEVIHGSHRGILRKGDVWLRHNSGGGGYGDPLERKPEAVLADVMNGLVSQVSAEGIYGVKINADNKINQPLTSQQRDAMIKWRKANSQLASTIPKENIINDHVFDSNQINETLQIEEGTIKCTKCGQHLGPATDCFKRFCSYFEQPLNKTAPWLDPFNISDKYLLRQYLCPHCYRLLSTDTVHC